MAKYDNFSKEELIELLKKQDEELARRKYGLVWDNEKEPEQVVVNCAKNLPVLKNVKRKDIKTDDSDYNIMIEGDNYHALEVLNYTHKGRIDVIYIDPPYNTGNKDFVYNDKFVDKEDGYRHSKWLNFMGKRLELAKKLLKENGVIFISIDDNEQANLKLLCDKIFGEKNFISNLSIENNPKGRKNSKYISVSNEYCLIYAKNAASSACYFRENIEKSGLKKDSRGRLYSSGKRVIVGKSSNKLVSNLSSSKHYTVYYRQNPRDFILKKELSVNSFNRDLVSANYSRYVSSRGDSFLENTYTNTKILELFKQDALIFRDDTIYEKDFNTCTRMKSLLTNDKINDVDLKTETANAALEQMGIKFSNPKNVKYIKLLLTLFDNTNFTILDFFAGSGTTGHAVLALNKQDGGTRKFILCTNNEGGVAEKVCYPRIKKVIQGYNESENGKFMEGLGGNFKYFKTDFVTNSKNRTQTRINLVRQCSEMLCLKTGIYNAIQENRASFKIYDNNKHNRFLCVYFDFFGKNMKTFIEKIKGLKGKKFIFVFSLDDNVDGSMFAGVKNAHIEAIPQKILDVYRKIAKEHIKGKK